MRELSVQISHIELLALKKLALINRALEQTLTDYGAKREQGALVRVLVEVIGRAEVAALQPKDR